MTATRSQRLAPKAASPVSFLLSFSSNCFAIVFLLDLVLWWFDRCEQSPQPGRTAKILRSFMFSCTDATAPFGYKQSKRRAPENPLVVKSSVVKKQERVMNYIFKRAGTSPGIFFLSLERLSLNWRSLVWMKSLAVALLDSFR